MKSNYENIFVEILLFIFLIFHYSGLIYICNWVQWPECKRGMYGCCENWQIIRIIIILMFKYKRHNIMEHQGILQMFCYEIEKGTSDSTLDKNYTAFDLFMKSFKIIIVIN